MRAVVAALAVLATLAAATACQPPGPPDRYLIAGHGWGHGRGMGQFGALGYAIDHGWSGGQILDHFYGGTTSYQAKTDPKLRVLLQGQDTRDLIAYNAKKQVRTSIDGYASHHASVRVHRVDGSHFQVYTGSTCSGPWHAWGGVRTDAEVTLKPPTTSNDSDYMLQLCQGTQTTYYRGDLTALRSNDTIRTVNTLSSELIVRSVIAREVAPSWADLGNGRGINAVRAQAVAARSYLRSGDSRWYPIANSCDTAQCQVYKGFAIRYANTSTVLPVEDPRTNLATKQTERKVRHMANGSVAHTEFSSSTGGYTVGGTFPAVLDLGDAVANNPNHDWLVSIPRSTIEAQFDARVGHDLGTVRAIKVTARDGNGSWGGRATSVRATFDGGDVDLGGNEFRLMFGLKTNWFRMMT